MLLAGLLTSCDTEDRNADSRDDYFENLKDHVIVDKSIATLECSKEQVYKTRTQEEVVYTIVARRTDCDLELVSQLYIVKSEQGYRFEHYTDDDLLLGIIECDFNLNIKRIEVEDQISTRGWNYWWVCTQYQYHKSKAELEESESMVLDVACDWLPCNTLNAALSGLYCMGVN